MCVLSSWPQTPCTTFPDQPCKQLCSGHPSPFPLACQDGAPSAPRAQEGVNTAPVSTFQQRITPYTLDNCWSRYTLNNPVSKLETLDCSKNPEHSTLIEVWLRQRRLTRYQDMTFEDTTKWQRDKHVSNTIDITNVLQIKYSGLPLIY